MNPLFEKVHSELKRSMGLGKCRKCGCMRTTLVNLSTSLLSVNEDDARSLHEDVCRWMNELEPMEYSCFKCKFCIPPEAMSLLTAKYPAMAALSLGDSCGFEVAGDTWPPVIGEYFVVEKNAPVAVSTLANENLPQELAALTPKGLCIIGKTETENIGIDKIVKNVVSNPALRFLIVAGKEPEGHKSGESLIALGINGVDGEMRIIGSTGRRPVLKNVTGKEVEDFRKQVRIENMLGCEDAQELISRIKELSEQVPASSAQTGRKRFSIGKTETKAKSAPAVPSTPRVKAEAKSQSVALDKAGYFVILPSKKDGAILVEHYSYDNKLLRIIEGETSRDIYLTIINNNWVSDLTHAAYLGKELTKAELSMKEGFKYVQDGA